MASFFGSARADCAGDPRFLAKIDDKKQLPPPGEAGRAGWVVGGWWWWWLVVVAGGWWVRHLVSIIQGRHLRHGGAAPASLKAFWSPLLLRPLGPLLYQCLISAY